MVDAKDRRLVELLVQNAIEGLRRSQVAAERLLDDDPGVFREARFPELLDHQSEGHRRNRQVARGQPRFAQLAAESLERRWILVIAVDVPQAAAQFVESGRIESP